MRDWKDRQRRDKHQLCQPAQTIHARFYREFGQLLITGGSNADAQQAGAALAAWVQDITPQVQRPHFASLWSSHCCVAQVSQELQERLRTLPPPQPPEPPSVTIGIDTATTVPLKLRIPERMRGMYIIGLNGTGKSTLLLEMMTQDMQAGRGLCLLDPHGDLTNAILDRVPREREEDVILLDLHGEEAAWGLNLFACPDPASPRAVTRTVDQVLQAFGKIWGDMGNTPGLADMLRTITVTLVSNPGTTMVDIQRLLTDEAFRNRLVANVQDRIVREFWELEYNNLSASGKQQLRASLLRRIRALLTPLLYNIVSQRTNRP